MQSRWITVIALAVALGAVLWGTAQLQAQKKAEAALHQSYLRDFYEAQAQVQALSGDLSKVLISHQVDLRLLEQIRLEALQAHERLVHLPGAAINLEQSSALLNQTADYILSLGQADLTVFSQEQWSNLQKLSQQAQLLEQSLSKMQKQIASGQSLTGLLEDQALAAADLESLEDNLEQFPELIYDGPFSDHLDRRSVLSGRKIEAEEAAEIALKLLGGEITEQRKMESWPPIYQITLQKDQQTTVAGITEQGGKLLWQLTERSLGEPQISLDQAQNQALAYLQKQGFGSLILTYQEQQDNRAVFNFAAIQEEVVLYGDLIKTVVALDRGDIIALEAADYWDSHQERDLPPVSLSEVQARQFLNPRLQGVSEGRLALIPLSAQKEVLTYEFKGRWGSDTYLVYINAQSGQQEKILQLD